MTRARPSRRASGFTLVELVVVLGIVGVVVSTAIYSLSRSSEAVSIERVSASLYARIERAQALAAVAGPRLGTSHLEYGPNCHQVPNDAQLWIEVNATAGRVLLPAHLTIIDPTTGAVRVDCEEFELNDPRRTAVATFTAPTANLVFAFTPDGRVIQPGLGNQSVFLRIRHDATGRSAGWRILSSGVMCAATSETESRCDEDA